MGADLLLSAMIHKTNKTLNWPAGRQVLRKMSGDEIQKRMLDINGDYCETVAEARKEANDAISELKRELANGGRDEYVWNLPGGYTIHIRGGTSWGDDPSDGWTAFTNAWAFPEALKAIGFVVQK